LFEPKHQENQNLPTCTLKPHCLHLTTFPGGPVLWQERQRLCDACATAGGVADCTEVEVWGRVKFTVHSYVNNDVRTLGRLVDGPASGVPSLLSRVFDEGRDSSRTGRTLRSAYLRQLSPHASHKMPVASPFGAFHQVCDSRVRHAAQLGVFEG